MGGYGSIMASDHQVARTRMVGSGMPQVFPEEVPRTSHSRGRRCHERCGGLTGLLRAAGPYLLMCEMS